MKHQLASPDKKKHKTCPSDPAFRSNHQTEVTYPHEVRNNKYSLQAIKFDLSKLTKHNHLTQGITKFKKPVKRIVKKTAGQTVNKSSSNCIQYFKTEEKNDLHVPNGRMNKHHKRSSKTTKSATCVNQPQRFEVKRSKNRQSYDECYKSVIEKRKHRTQMQQQEEYIMFEDKIIKVSAPDGTEIKDRIQDQMRQSVNINSEESMEQSEEFFNIQKFYGQKATLIQKVWRGYCTRKRVNKLSIDKTISKSNCRGQRFIEISQLLSSNIKQDRHTRILSSQQSLNHFSERSIEPLEIKQNFNSISEIYNECMNPHISYIQQLSYLLSAEQYNAVIKSRFNSNNDFLQYLYNSQLISLNEFIKKTTQFKKQMEKQKGEAEHFKSLIKHHRQKVLEMLRGEQNQYKIRYQIKEKMEETVESGVNNKEQIDRILKSIGFKQEIEEINSSIVSHRSERIDGSFDKANKEIDTKSKQEKQIYTKQFQDILDSTPIEKFPTFVEENHLMKSLIEQRILSQLGYVIVPRVPVDTSLPSLYSFIDVVFDCVSRYHLDEFIYNINEVYGYFPEDRLKILIRNYQQEQQSFEMQQIIPQNVLTLIQQEYTSYDNLNLYQQIHNKAIFDAINENIHQFRPYYFSNGIPYSWCQDRVLTFYEIGRENIYEVFDKIKHKIIRVSSSLCGLQVPKADDSQQTSTNFEEAIDYCPNLKIPIEGIKRTNLIKSEEAEIGEGNYRWSLWDQQLTRVGLELSEFIFLKLIIESVAETYKISKSQ